MTTMKHDLKHLHCNTEAGGCGLVYTIPKEHNSKHEEMRQHKRLSHGYKPQLIDKQSKDLRDMTETEHKAHLDHIKDVVDKHVKEIQKTIPHNTITVKEVVINGVIYHDLEIDPVYAKMESELKKLESAEDGSINKMVSQVLVKCPKCGKVGATIQRTMEPRPKET